MATLPSAKHAKATVKSTVLYCTRYTPSTCAVKAKAWRSSGETGESRGKPTRKCSGFFKGERHMTRACDESRMLQFYMGGTIWKEPPLLEALLYLTSHVMCHAVWRKRRERRERRERRGKGLAVTLSVSEETTPAKTNERERDDGAREHTPPGGKRHASAPTRTPDTFGAGTAECVASANNA